VALGLSNDQNPVTIVAEGLDCGESVATWGGEGASWNLCFCGAFLNVLLVNMCCNLY
jgi:hypothetical protein